MRSPTLVRCTRWLAAAGLALSMLALPAAAFDLQGHRGARGLVPENSLPGFERAMAHGVTTLELDVAVTRDGVMVIHHDLGLNPNTTRDEQGRWLEQPGPMIHAMSFAELQRYDVGRLKPGTPYARNHPDQVGADGVRVPRLSDLFALVKAKGAERMRFAIEIKTDPRLPDATRAPEAMARQLVDEVRAAGLESRVQILSFDWRSLQEVQRIAPAIPTVYLSAQQRFLDNIGADAALPSPWTAGFGFKEHGSVPRMIKAAGGRIWSVYMGDVDGAKIREAQSLGLKVLVWTVNDPAVMDRLVAAGVDGLVTDRPDLAQDVLKRRGIKPE